MPTQGSLGVRAWQGEGTALPVPSHLSFRKVALQTVHLDVFLLPSLLLSTGKHLNSLNLLPKLSSFQVTLINPGV